MYTAQQIAQECGLDEDERDSLTAKLQAMLHAKQLCVGLWYSHEMTHIRTARELPLGTRPMAYCSTAVRLDAQLA